ncbi:MAG: indolepyruvate ferredoxin oxidoreductase family protein [Gammaproteobacteria bacterium]|nr:indolepyruvate ferredoxin oxidoreductase family protein [Gammaproteobacteria bacterium]MDH3411274.1 indolepyruvate ferredoxin oxidoreductase family protein [Gammaproteobacteria bacterium]
MNERINDNTPRLREVSLDDKYILESGRVFLTGIQALVRLPLMQRQIDLAAGHNTAGYISGYRGSPLGAYDQQVLRAQHLLDAHHVRFQPGVNEDLAATACWGTQQAELNGEGAYDGVFAIWYGKGPGVDRSGDAFRHANLAGTSPLGGVISLLGDDHTCESSTTSHHSEYAMVDASIPVLNPAGVQEVLDYGLYGIALSRYSGCWVALKCVHDTVESAASIEIGPDRARVVLPDDYRPPDGGLSIRWPDTPQAQEARLYEHKLEAAKAFCRANRLDRLIWDSPNPRIGIITTGKSYLDVRQALADIGVDENAAGRLGLRLYKVAMPFPLEPEGAVSFCRDLDLVIVVEEKRALIETQLKDLMYGRQGAPSIVGKRDEKGQWQFPSAGRLDTNRIAVAVGERLTARVDDDALAASVSVMRSLTDAPSPPSSPMQRTPYFCAGCPHSSSTRVPEGSRALAGIGCHYLAQFMDRDTARYTQMGAEGASWIGEAPFSRRKHMFQNVGDGTYFHSGVMAIRAAIAANTNITFKILYNDAVAMTGGQPMDGPLTVDRITWQMHSEGARRVVVVSDEPEKYRGAARFAPGVSVHHRDQLDIVQRELREIDGVTVLVYDQTCAAEKRRRRKRGKYPDPPKRVFINDLVCEGCGDCGVKSNCVAVVPLETELGRKRAIDQSACNKDYSCLNGFCPSFVTVHGGRPRKGLGASGGVKEQFPALPEPLAASLDRPYNIVVTGVGGTGVITIGALLGMAAHLEFKGCSILDQTGLAQKGGSVVSHVRIATGPDDITATRIAAGAADLVLGCDMVVAGGRDALSTMRSGRTRAVVNSHETMTGDFTRNADLAFPSELLLNAIKLAVVDNADFIEATRVATALMGDAIATNLFMLGYAFQKGLVPVSSASIDRAIELNGVAVEMNKEAFLWGRRAAADLERVNRIAFSGAVVAAPSRPKNLDELIEHRTAFLIDYQDNAYADRYRGLVAKVRKVETEAVKGRYELAQAVARYYFKLLAYKDEYEVARLYTSGEFERKLDRQFEGDYRIEFHLAPPLLAKADPATGEPKKRRYGWWMLRVFRLLSKMRRLRGTALDVFGFGEERKRERGLIDEYERTVAALLDGLNRHNHALAVDIACIPEHIRGFGPIKRRAIDCAKERERELIAEFKRPSASPEAA